MPRSPKSSAEAPRKPTPSKPTGKPTSRKAANESRWQPPVSGRHIVAFWKQNDLGLFGRRPDRLLAQWQADPSIEKIAVFELPATLGTLHNWVRLAAQPDAICASEFRLLLTHFYAKFHGECNTDKLTYCSYLQAEEGLQGPRYLRWVIAKLQQLQINASEVWVWPICAINDALLKAMAPSRIVADFVDDQRLFPGTGSVKKSYTDQYQWLLSRADQVVSNSKGLISEFKKEFGQAIDLLENADLLAPGPEDHASPAATKPKKSKGERFQVGFVGNMRGRMNIPLMQELIRGYEEVDFVFVGQTHGSDFYKACAKEPNVRFMGTLPQAQADAAAQGFDLAIIPFVRDALVKSMSPIKSVTFNRLGVPTISTLELSEAAFRKAFHEATQ